MTPTLQPSQHNRFNFAKLGDKPRGDTPSKREPLLGYVKVRSGRDVGGKGGIWGNVGVKKNVIFVDKEEAYHAV